MKTMKTYYIPETEVMDLHGEYLMGDLTGSIGQGGPGTSGEVEAPMRHVGSLGPSY